MVTINEEERKGLSFNDWIDVFLTIEDDAIIGNPLLDLEGYERFWFQFLMEWRKCKDIPPLLKEAKGIGNCIDPQVIIVTDQLNPGNRLGRGMEEYGHKYWNLPKYRRLRPFNETKTQLKFFYNLLHDLPEQMFYITAFKKSWIRSPPESLRLFHQEMDEVYTDGVKIICLGYGVYEKMGNWDRALLDWPAFMDIWHGHDWARYREKFRNLVKI